jgi:hypothetical protein
MVGFRLHHDHTLTSLSNAQPSISVRDDSLDCAWGVTDMAELNLDGQSPCSLLSAYRFGRLSSASPARGLRRALSTDFLARR